MDYILDTIMPTRILDFKLLQYKMQFNLFSFYKTDKLFKFTCKLRFTIECTSQLVNSPPPQKKVYFWYVCGYIQVYFIVWFYACTYIRVYFIVWFYIETNVFYVWFYIETSANTPMLSWPGRRKLCPRSLRSLIRYKFATCLSSMLTKAYKRKKWSIN
jgi:hypothetical protein